MTRVAIVGAGIVGACIAHALNKRGADVTLIDRDAPGHGCSYGNSGAISPGSVAPLAMPGILATLPRMLRDPESPLYLPLAYLPRALPWLLGFLASARPEKVAANADKLAALHAGAVERHVKLATEVGVPELVLRQGHLHLYPDEAAIAKDATGWRMRQEHGYTFERLDRRGILALEPHVGERYQAALFLPGHATIRNPLRYVQAIVRSFVANGGQVISSSVEALAPQAGGGWQVQSAGGSCQVSQAGAGWQVPSADARQVYDHVVVAAGAWSRRLLDPLGVPIALESQRGYHVQFQGAAQMVSRTVVLADRKVFVTPMEDGLRVGGTVEIGGLHSPPDMRRAELLKRVACETFAGLDGFTSTQWMGHRPCMPDSVPIVGPAAGKPGLWLAVGHGRRAGGVRLLPGLTREQAEQHEDGGSGPHGDLQRAL